MNASSIRVMFALAALGCALLLPSGDVRADGETDRRLPSIGYVYPAGGREGTVFQVVVGGQNLRGPIGAHVSGEGVTARVLRHVRPLRLQQQRELARRIQTITRDRRRVAEAAERAGGRGKKQRPKKAAAPEKVKDPIELPQHPLLDDLAALGDRELERVAARFLGGGRKRQPNAQIAETVELEIEVAPGVEPGWREIRLQSRSGLTNPVRFRVGDSPEVCEHESLTTDEATEPALPIPVVVNGQIQPGDVDRHRVTAARGQRLVVSVAARDLVPFLADAVPGWFQATLAVRDPSGRELAFADDFEFEPDPRLVFDVPADGEYVIEIRDAIHRGREDFVYRLDVREDLARAWTPSRGDVGPHAAPRVADGLPICRESEPNDGAEAAQGVLVPTVIRGKIAFAGDIDSYVFDGEEGQDVVIEIEARRSFSPLDAVVRVADPSGEVIAWCDDHDDGLSGLITHPADPYLRLRLPESGAYTVRVADVRGHGGVRHAYRLRIGPPRPDFDVVVTPSSLSIPSGRTVPFRVHAIRRDGFEGPIDVRLVDAPEGYRLSGGRIPAGVSSVRVTLTAPQRAPTSPAPLGLEGLSAIGEHEVVRAAIPADDRMQAFLWRHLVPAAEWVVAITKSGRLGPPVKRLDPAPVSLPVRDAVRVGFRVRGLTEKTPLHARLDGAHPGLVLDGWEIRRETFTVLLRASDAGADVKPFTGNVIVAVYADVRDGKGRMRRTFVGYLPAISVAPSGR